MMTARARPTLAMRPMRPMDVPVLAEIFRASIEGLTLDDYDAAQQQSWASLADDQEAFATRLAQRLTLLGTVDGSPAGFASLNGDNQIDMLYVHPAAAGQGVGTMLVDALEKLAASRGAGLLTADVSDNAQQFFKRRGYVARRRNSVPIGAEWLTNTTMEKKLPLKGNANDQT
jgi:putative acetyltransferase